MNKLVFGLGIFWAYCILSGSCQYYDEERAENGNDNRIGGGRQDGPGGQRQQGQQGGQEYVDSSEDTESEATTKVAAAVTAATIPPITSTINPVHVQGQVNNILNNVNSFNISGIVDSSLGIRNNTPVRNLVNGIISSVFCNVFFIRINPGCGGQTVRSLTPVGDPLYDYIVYRVPRSEGNKDWLRKMKDLQNS